MTNEALKKLITDTIVHTLRNPKKNESRPTIEQLEKMLNCDEPARVDILPDGSITAELPIYASDLADAIIEAMEAAGKSSKI